MKKNFKLAFVVLAAICMGQQVKAQVHDAQANVNIILTDAMSITLNTSDVNIEYATAADYGGPKTKSMPNHFKVISNKTYDVQVEIDNQFSPALNLSNLGLTVRVASSTPTGGGLTDAILTTISTPQALVTGAPASVGTLYNVDYIIPEATELLDKTAGTYSSTVTYRISAN
ncbi:MAG: hypothetical protein LBF27_30200 [Sphingobacterium sp.]|jgi:hypothetical protein|nr:hypothetical protein [Sphingobacterium sp.]